MRIAAIVMVLLAAMSSSATGGDLTLAGRVAAAVAPSATATVDLPSPSGGVQITGRVTDIDGRGVPEALVFVNVTLSEGLTLTRNDRWTTSSDQNGMFEFDGLPEDVGSIMAVADGYRQRSRMLEDLDATRPILLTVPRDLSDERARVTVRPHFATLDGAPAPRSVWVGAVRASGFGWRASDGELMDLEAGRWRIRVLPEGTLPILGPEILVPRNSHQAIDVACVVDRGRSVEGCVTGAGGEAVSATISLLPLHEPVVGAWTRSDGSFRIDGSIPDGPCELLVRAHGFHPQTVKIPAGDLAPLRITLERRKRP